MNISKNAIYSSWTRLAAYRMYYTGLGVVALLMLLWIGIDALTFNRIDAAYYRTVRLCIVACMLALGLIPFAIERYTGQRPYLLIQRLVLCPLVFLNGTYLWILSYALHEGDPNALSLVHGGVATVILCSYMYLGKFTKYLLAFFLLSVVMIAVIHSLRPYGHNSMSTLRGAHLAGFICGYYFNRSIKDEIYDKFLNYKKILPVRIARDLAITGHNIEAIEESKPMEKFSAFIISDWRSYQVLAAKLDSAQIARLFTEVYSLAFQKLPEICPDLTYYVSWTADEHRVLFYDLQGSEERTRQMAVTYAKFLQEELPEQIRGKIGLR